ncbi:hypothetical protein MRB53_026141 [Persea americana]|uniref:Uncharacterized protein n=1 Tax=Persea americana TaxID=3435 RepID=A0ACC2LH56_PERAE|nr:hypothetical protein MRB53_026141 [Persea americana]
MHNVFPAIVWPECGERVVKEEEMCGVFSEIDWPGYGERESSERGGDARRLPGDLLAWLWRERAEKEEETRSVLRKRRRCAVMPPVITSVDPVKRSQSGNVPKLDVLSMWSAYR